MYVLSLVFRTLLPSGIGQSAFGLVRFSRPSKRIPAVVISLATALLSSVPPASAITIGLTRFGTCFPAAACSITINDNDPLLDLNPMAGVIQYSTVVGIAPNGIYTASGTATETGTPGGGILMTLTDATVQGIGGGVGAPPLILGQIAMISAGVISSLDGVAGFASLVGEYQSFPNTVGGNIGFADVLLQARLGGALLGLVDPPPAVGTTSPTPFAGFDARVFPFPVSNVLIGTLDFQVRAGDGFFLPMSMDVSATPIPEPSTVLSLALGLIGLVALSRRRRSEVCHDSGQTRPLS